MEKKHRFALRKTTMGLVSAMILGVTISPIFGTGVMSASAAEEKADEESEIMLINAELDDSDVEYVRWTANPIRQIEEEIARQLAMNKTEEDVDEDELNNYEIRWGDTVWGITQAHDLDMDQFVEVNDIDNPDLIYAGDIVTLDTSAKKESEVSNEVDSANDEETIVEGESVKDNSEATNTSKETSNNEDESKDTDVKDEGNFSASDSNNDDRAPEIDDIVSGGENEDSGQSDDKIEVEDDKEEDSTPENDSNDKEDSDKEESEDESNKEDEDEIVDSETEEDTEDIEIPEDEEESEDEDFEEDIVEDEDESEKDEEEDEKDVIRKEVVERKFTIKHGTIYKEDNTLPKGEQKVVQNGQNGQRVETYERVYVNDKLDSETLLSDEIRQKAVDKVVHVGTQTVDVKRDTVIETKHHDTVYKETDSLFEGEEKVEQKAIPTKIEKIYETKIINGEEQERKLVDEKVVQKGQPKVVLVGTKERFDINSYEIDAELLNQEMLKIVNEFRADIGVDPLIYDAELQEGANVRAKDLLEMEQIDHARPDGSDWRSAFDYLDYDPAYALGENIAMNFVSLDVVDQVENGEITFEAYLADEFAWQFYRSEGHYQNMIDPDYNKFATQSIVHPETGNKMFNAMILSTRD